MIKRLINKDTTKITSKSTADVIINALKRGIRLSTNYDPTKFISIIKNPKEHSQSEEKSEIGFKHSLMRQFSKLNEISKEVTEIDIDDAHQISN